MVRWIIQRNLMSDEDRGQIQEFLDICRIPYAEFDAIPFSNELPDFPIDDEHENAYYGSTRVISQIYEKLDNPIGVFFDHETFSMENYFNQWGEHMLNYNAQVITVKDFLKTEDNDSDEMIFIRPDKDDKSFNGTVMPINKTKEMIENLLHNDMVTSRDKIVIGPAYRILREWRCYIVNGKLVTSSMYKEEYRLRKAEGTPRPVKDFVRNRLKEYMPHDCLAMDIAEVKDPITKETNFYIIECGCLNSVGLYDSNIKELFARLSGYVELQEYRERLSES